ncbi:MAG TPA: type II secretion system secretin GspD [Methylocystis sp.]
MSKRPDQTLLAAICFALAACQATADPPVAEWSVEPQSGGREPSYVGSGSRSEGLSLTRSAGSGGLAVQGTGRFVGADRTTSKIHPDAAGESAVTLNLVNLPIAEATKVVLGDILGVDYVVDAALAGKVTVHTADPVRKTAALELFQSALRVAGAAVVRSGELYKVVPLDQAATAGGGVSTAPVDRSSLTVGENTRVVQLRYVSASEMKRVLEPMTVHGGIVRADDARHTLTLSGTQQDLATLEDVITMFDVDTMRGMSFALVPVKSADADALAEDLRHVFGTDDKDGPMSGQVRFIGNKRLAAILVISAQPQYLSRARAWIERLDARAQGNERQFFTYRVQNRPAKELLEVLASMFGGNGAGHGANNVAPRFGQSSVSSGGDSGPFGQSSAPPTSPLGALSSSGPTSGPGGAPGGPNGAPGFFGSSGAGPGGSGFGANSGGPNDQPQSKGPQAAALGEDNRFKLGVDEAKNALVIMATPDDYKRIRRVIEALDVAPNQVFIEATIAEVSLTDELHFGVAWFLQKGAHAGAFSGQIAGPNNVPTVPNSVLGNNLLGAPVGSIFPGFSYAVSASNVLATLNALNAITNVNILSTPSLTVLDNRQAVLQVGDQIPVTTLQSVAPLGNTFNSVSYLNTGVILAITPHISESGRLMLDIDQEVSNTVPGTALGGNNPTIQQRKVKTQVAVADGESLMLGGLIQDSRSRNANQIPVAGDFPIVGNLFKDKDDTIDKKELIIMITPHVVRSLSEAREIAEEYKRKMLNVASKAVARPHDIEQSTRRTLLDDTSVSPWVLDRASR